MTPVALTALGVRVKPLVWQSILADAFWAKCAVGSYRVEERGGLWKCVLHRIEDAKFIAETDNEADAKAAAQADYESRICAALTTGENDD